MNSIVKEIVNAGGIHNYYILDVLNSTTYILFNEQNTTVELRYQKNCQLCKRVTWTELDCIVKSGDFRLLKEISIRA